MARQVDGYDSPPTSQKATTRKLIQMRSFSFLLALVLVWSPIFAQELPAPSEVSVGSVQTNGNGSSLQGTYKYELPLQEGEVFRVQPEKFILDATPEVFINFSEGPEFNSIVLKFNGNFIRPQFTKLPGIPDPQPDSSKLAHIFPFSLGLEADQSFDNAALVAEVGYVPFKKISLGNRNFILGSNPRVGIFAQAGYKFGLSEESDTGAATDQSSEAPDNEIGRIKVSGRLNYPIATFGTRNPTKVSLLISADYWFDVVNSDTYDRAEAVVRLGLNDKTNLDFKFENGSGAPNFNEGEQFGIFLNTSF